MIDIQFKDINLSISTETKSFCFTKGYKIKTIPFLYCNNIIKIRRFIDVVPFCNFMPCQLRSAKNIDDLFDRLLKSKKTSIYNKITDYFDVYELKNFPINYNHKDLTEMPDYNLLFWSNGVNFDEGGWQIAIVKARDFDYDDLYKVMNYKTDLICAFKYKNEHWLLIGGEFS